MKKIFLLFFIVLKIVYADLCTEYAGDEYYVSSVSNNLPFDSDDLVHHGDEDDDCELPSWYNLKLIDAGSHQVVQGSSLQYCDVADYPCQMCKQLDNYNCSVCSEEDKSYSVPSGKEQVLNLDIFCDTKPNEKEEKIQQCEQLGGTYFTLNVIHCCSHSVCIIDSNSTSPDDNSSDPNSDDGSHPECGPDTYYDDSLGKCQCNSGYVPGNECHNSDCSDLECVPDTCNVPYSHSDGDKCVCDIGYTSVYDLSTGELLECQYDSSDNDDSSDPCSYADSENGFEYRGKNYDSSVCQDDINSYGCGNGTFVKHDGCSFGACYYNYDLDCPQGDDNSTDGSSSDDGDTSHNSTDDNDTSSSTVDDNSTTSLALDKLDKSINIGVDKITDAVKNNTHVLSDKLSILDSTISSGVDKISNSIDSEKSVLHNDLEDIKDLLKGDHSEDEATLNDTFSNTNNIVQDALSSFKVSQENLQALADGARPPVFSTAGDCSLSASLFGGKGNFKIDLRPPAELIAPYFHFALDIALLILTIRFYITIVLSIASLFS